MPVTGRACFSLPVWERAWEIPDGTETLGKLIRPSHTLSVYVAQALLPAVSRLVSTRLRGCGTASKPSVGMSARPRAHPGGRSAYATLLRQTCEKSKLKHALPGWR
jgi:hypothetical protein